MKNNTIIEELIGWYGAIAIVVSYALLSFGVLSGDAFWYHFWNGTGAICIVYISLKRKNYQPAVLNIVWTIIALFGILKSFNLL